MNKTLALDLFYQYMPRTQGTVLCVSQRIPYLIPYVKPAVNEWVVGYESLTGVQGDPLKCTHKECWFDVRYTLM